MTEDVLDEPEAQAIIVLQPFWHFLVLSFFTCGIYPMVWAYKVWMQLREDNFMRRDPILDIILHPVVRVLLDWVFSFSLFRHVTQAAKQEKCAIDYSPMLFAMAFSFLSIFGRRLEFPFFLLIFVFWVPYIPLFFTFRHYLEAKNTICIYRHKFKTWEMILLFLGFHASFSILTLAFNPDLLRDLQQNSMINIFQ